MWVAEMFCAMTSLVMKLSVVPGQKCLGQMIEDWVVIVGWKGVLGRNRKAGSFVCMSGLGGLGV